MNNENAKRYHYIHAFKSYMQVIKNSKSYSFSLLSMSNRFYGSDLMWK